MNKPLISIFLTMSITALALSLVYLAVTINRASQQAPALISELKALNTSIPPMIEEAKKVREDIPGFIEDFDTLMANSRETGQKAGEGAVTGVVTGVVKAPFSLISALASSFGGSVRLSKEEREVIAVAMDNLLATNEPGVTYPFAHPTSGMTGMLELTALNSVKETNQYEVGIQILRNDVSLIEKDIILEQNSRGELKLIKRRNNKTNP